MSYGLYYSTVGLPSKPDASELYQEMYIQRERAKNLHMQIVYPYGEQDD
jgi:hypothetical protein